MDVLAGDVLDNGLISTCYCVVDAAAELLSIAAEMDQSTNKSGAIRARSKRINAVSARLDAWRLDITNMPARTLSGCVAKALAVAAVSECDLAKSLATDLQNIEI